jgi:hypothetical protein
VITQTTTAAGNAGGKKHGIFHEAIADRAEELFGRFRIVGVVKCKLSPIGNHAKVCEQLASNFAIVVGFSNGTVVHIAGPSV